MVSDHLLPFYGLSLSVPRPERDRDGNRKIYSIWWDLLANQVDDLVQLRSSLPQHGLFHFAEGTFFFFWGKWIR